MKEKFYNRELSWLSFNYRVLQEAKDTSVPLYERIKFLAIFSSNLDEFFRVRVASIRSLLNLKDKTQKKLEFDPARLLKKIYKTVDSHQEQFGEILRNSIIPELNKNNIFLINESELTESQSSYICNLFDETILPYMKPMLIVKKKITPFLQNKVLYLAVRLSLSKTKNDDTQGKNPKYKYALLEIPGSLKRFVKLPEEDGKNYIIYIDDIIRFSLPKIFHGYKIVDSYSIKLNRDAELYIDDEFTGNLLEKIKKGLSKRKTGLPSRFLYDKRMPKEFLRLLRESFNLQKEDLFPGGRYHNLNDFFSFPNPLKNYEYQTLEPLHCAPLEADNIYNAVKKEDHLLYYPYHTYSHFINFLNKAALDDSVTAIKITLYRVANNSEVVKALITAAKGGKKVTAFVELKARFDEESNIFWAKEMEDAGIEVVYSLPGIKVHAKLCLVYHNEDNVEKLYSYLGTGNFNEKTSRIYTDYGFFTADKNITGEVHNVFDYLCNKNEKQDFKHLLVAQFNMKKCLLEFIDNEIANSLAGKKAYIIMKLNSIEDRSVIKRLYEASQAGVKVYLIIRGICCLIPGVKGMSENIKVISIVDRFLEHARVFIFHNDGEEKYFLGSADCMTRNLNRRVEVAFPIYNKTTRNMVRKIIDIQLKDNTKARIINQLQTNKYKISKSSKTVRAQMDIYEVLKNST